ncbi:MAG: hypothetical protein HY033_09390 [Ignavibacteriae bacterium]|nr:hypothetical protein [Ignavibacteriota bacterium]
MTTKPPSPVQEYPADSLEIIAYQSVSTIPTQEPNDQNRLGYHIWRWLMTKQGTLEQAIAESGARLNVSKQDALKTIREALAKRGASA